MSCEKKYITFLKDALIKIIFMLALESGAFWKWDEVFFVLRALLKNQSKVLQSYNLLVDTEKCTVYIEAQSHWI